jgi:hypothetical protein
LFVFSSDEFAVVMPMRFGQLAHREAAIEEQTVELDGG